MLRKEGRLASELRPTVITKNVQEFAEGSVMISTGKTQVLCAVSVVEGVPRFLEGAGRGWVTAEYAMLTLETNRGYMCPISYQNYSVHANVS